MLEVSSSSSAGSRQENMEEELSIEYLLQELAEAEVLDAQEYQRPITPEGGTIPVRIVSCGLEGECVLAPRHGGGVTGSKDGGETVQRRVGWREAISTSALPFGSSSLPALNPCCDSELEERYLNVGTHIADETEENGVDEWFDKNTWCRGLGDNLLTVAMSGARSTMVIKPSGDLKSFLGAYLEQRLPFPFECGELDSGWKVEAVPLDADAASGYSVSSLDKPTARLSQYARGKTGGMNPFTPGGEDLPSSREEGGPLGRVKVQRKLATQESGNPFLTVDAIAGSVAALDPQSNAPLLSVPPSVSFSHGLTPDHVRGGPPPWAAQVRRDRMRSSLARKQVENVEAETGRHPPPPPDIGQAPTSQNTTSGLQRVEAPKVRAGEGSNTIDLSAMFADFGSDLESAGESSSDNEDGDLAFDIHESDAGVHESSRDGQESTIPSLEGLSPSPTGATGEGEGSEKEESLEAPLDSLLASAAQSVGDERSLAQQALTKHLLKPPDERKKPSSGAATGRHGTSQRDTPSGNATASVGTKRTGAPKWAVTELLDISNFDALIPRPAHRFPFTLDDFQKQAVARLERAECVFVSAHTSAGKTVVAEYAIAMAQQHMTRAIYTSPIKALSNQKYRDFKTRFGDVGLITGDISINPEASCLIMTTEILRSMLYRGADLIRDIEWVIFDEGALLSFMSSAGLEKEIPVHYVNDPERGVVWEEVIIMLPDHANMIFLSATTPNTVEFCDWIGRTKRKPVHVVTTSYRPVPLEHFLLVSNELHQIMDNYGKFDSNGYAAAAAKLEGKGEKKSGTAGGKGQRGGAGGGQGRGTGRGGGRGGGGGRGRGARGRDTPGSKSQWQALVKKLEKDGMLPVVVFSFSKKKCQECADALSSVTLTSAKEKSEIHIFCATAVKRLQDQDAKLPQVLVLKEMLSRGIGVHHGGLLPILKEIVEICFSRGLVKVLFATETFAMGVNMPARTVVFNSTRKHDGKDFRDLLPGEYTQMAGRAGRRGLDKVGTVIITCWSEPPPLVNLKMMLTGTAMKLESQFRLKWNMILNLLRVEDMSVEDMMKRSFSEFRTQRELGAKNLPKILKKCSDALNKLESQVAMEPCIRGEESMIDEYFMLSNMVSDLSHDLLSYGARASKNARAVLGSRRGIIINANTLVNAPAIILRGPDEHGGKGISASTGGSRDGDDLMRKARAQAQGASVEEAAKLLVVALCPQGFIIPSVEKHGQGDTSGPNATLTEAASSSDPMDPFARSSGHVLKRKDDRDRDGWGGGGSSSGGKGRKGGRVTLGSDSFGMSRGEPLGVGAYRDVNGRTCSVLEVGFDEVVSLARSWKKMNPEGLLDGDRAELASVMKMLFELESTLPSEKDPAGKYVPPNLATELKIQDVRFVESANELGSLLESRVESKCHTCPKLADQYHLRRKREKLEKKVEFLQHATSSEALSLFPDFQQRLGVLRSLEYVEDNTVQLKGRVACEINTCDELIASEIVFENVLERLEPPEIAGILSALVFQEKTSNEPPLTDRLKAAVDQVVTIARSLGRLQQDHGLPTDPDENVKLNLNFGLVDVVYEWARGVPFYEITQITLVQEGSVVRTITRLEWLCREVRNAARVIGDPTLYRKMETTSQLIKRDIVFAASLYVT